MQIGSNSRENTQTERSFQKYLEGPKLLNEHQLHNTAMATATRTHGVHTINSDNDTRTSLSPSGVHF